MFKIVSQRLTWVKVQWPALAEDGSPIENTVELQIELVNRDDLVAQIEASRMSGSTVDYDFAARVTKDWRGVGDEQGNKLAFSADNFAKLYQAPGFAAAHGERYLKAWNGIADTREGNSEGSPAVGQSGESAAQTPAS